MALIRDIDPVTLAALGGVFCPVVFVYIDWPVTPVRAHSNVGTISFGGNSWMGVGSFGSVEVPQEAGLVPDEATVWVLGTTEKLLADMGVSVASLRNKAAEILFGVTTQPGGTTLIGSPVSLFSGYFDSRSMPTQMTDAGVQERLQAVLGSGPSARSSARIVHSNEDQQAKYPGDTLFRHTAFADSRRSNPAAW